MGAGFALLRLDPLVRVTGIIDAAAKCRLPLVVLDVSPAEVSGFYHHKLVLVRPDQNVAWRGDAEPSDPLNLVDMIRGASRGVLGKAS